MNTTTTLWVEPLEKPKVELEGEGRAVLKLNRDTWLRGDADDVEHWLTEALGDLVAARRAQAAAA